MGLTKKVTTQHTGENTTIIYKFCHFHNFRGTPDQHWKSPWHLFSLFWQIWFICGHWRFRWTTHFLHYHRLLSASVPYFNSESMVTVLRAKWESGHEEKMLAHNACNWTINNPVLLTHWFVWSPSISRMTPFSCSLAAVYFRDCGFHFLLPLSSPLLSSFMDLRAFLNVQSTVIVYIIWNPHKCQED